MKLAVFDSGIGGVTVLNELKCQFPDVDFFYFGDTANVPYGSKSETHIKELVSSACARIRTHQIDALVIACNTAASIAYNEFRRELPGILLFNVVEAGVQSILISSVNDQKSPIVIFGTRATIHSRLYSKLLLHENKNFEIHEIACPLLAPMIEEGWIDHPILHETVKEYTSALLASVPGVALLACTHYPWIQKSFERALPGWKILNSAQSVASIVKDQQRESNEAPIAQAEIKWFFSDTQAVNINLLNIDSASLKSF